VEGPSGTVRGHVISAGVVAAVLALVVGIVVSTTRPDRHHGSTTSASAGAELPLYYVTMASVRGDAWYPANYSGYTDGIAIRKGPSTPVTCAAGSRCGNVAIMSKRSCPTSLTLHFDVTRGFGGVTVGSATASSGSVAAREPVTLTYSYVSDESGLAAVISDITCN
jgi:hypothetical protein